MSDIRRKVQVHLYIPGEAGAPARFLVLKRPDERGGWWQPVTGKLEGPEAPEAGAMREVWEETGIQQIHDLLRVWEFEYESQGRRFHETVYCARVESDDVRVSGEHDACCWIPAGEARERIHFDSNKEGLDRAVAALMEKKRA